MPVVTLSAIGKNAGIDALTALLNAGSTNPAGRIRWNKGSSLQIGPNFSALSNPAFAAASGGSATANAIANCTIPSGEPSPTTIQVAIFQDRNGGEVFRSNVGAGQDINGPDLSVQNGDEIALSSLTMSYL